MLSFLVRLQAESSEHRYGALMLMTSGPSDGRLSLRGMHKVRSSFTSADDLVYRQKQAFIPFSYGPRACVGRYAILDNKIQNVSANAYLLAMLPRWNSHSLCPPSSADMNLNSTRTISRPERAFSGSR